MTSAWIIQYMSLVDSYLNDIDTLKLSTEDLKYIIDSCNKVDSAAVRKKEFFVRNLYTLRDIWDLIADLYLKIAEVPTNQKTPEKSPKQGEINIVANKLDEIEEQLEKELNGEFEDDEVFEKDPNELQKSASEESVTKMLLKESTNPFISTERPNPFNKKTSSLESQNAQQVSPEIEMQRKISMQKDEESKRSSLSQLITASMELLRLLPNESTENIRLLLTNKINESFLVVEQHDNNVGGFK